MQNCDGLLKGKLASKAQIATATELYVELLGFDIVEIILSHDLYSINEKCIGDAQTLLKRATKKKLA